MRRTRLSFRIIFAFFCVFLFNFAFFTLDTSAINTENFYFENFTGDYYLSRDKEGISHLKVVESFTAVFPEHELQNKGICRTIPFTNQDNANVTLPSLTRANIKLTRNGLEEPIYSLVKEKNYYEVCTGDDDYVFGKQVYTFEYEFEKVVTDFKDHQELYWDTNGNGWRQRFDNVTVRVHFAPELAKYFTGNSWCYVGRYGEEGSTRCEVSDISDGVRFETENLSSYENLTFDVEIKAGSFVVPEPVKNYILIIVMVGFFIVCALLLINAFRKFLKTRDKARYYKGLFVKPEFTPDKNYNVAEMAEIFIGKKHDAKVAVLLEMIVNHQINLVQKGETTFGRKKWAVKVLNVNGISDEGMYLLRILAGGEHVSDGEEITIKTRTANSMLVSLRKSYEQAITTNLKKHGLVEESYKSGTTISRVVLAVVISFLALIAEDFLETVDSNKFEVVGKAVGEEFFMPVMIGTMIVVIVVSMVLNDNTMKFVYRTKKGLEASRYMDGLRLYIEMAEKDRLKFLQSAVGAEVTPDGIVKLYEKLLPYAAVLGLEKSWMKELEKYYKLEEVTTPDWYVDNVVMYSVLNAVNTAADTVSSSTSYSGGSSSSGFSGGGGGGFSGGGGGGGGGGGR